MNKNAHSAKRNRRSPLVVVFAAALVAGLSLCAAAFYLLSPVSEDFSGARDYRLEVPQGMTTRAIAKELKENRIIRSDLAFYAYARFDGATVKAGSYVVTRAMGVKEILLLLESGRSAQFAVSVPEGFTINKIASLFEARGVCKAEDFIESAHDRELLAEYDIPGGSFQGYLFPDTYFFLPDTDAGRVIRMMADTFYQRIGTISGAEKITAKQLYDKVILASIVEREYRVASEAPLISSVFVNRINQRWGLYSCATIEFIITEIQGKPHPDVITVEDTKIDNPYNTYMWMGLPPGPISNPGIVALEAAFNPAKTNYYYFRVADAARGAHHFSADFSEHVEIGRELTKRAAGF
jgi:UPF0755 protein